MIRRREFIMLLGGVSAWPLAARAQQSATPVIGFLSSSSPGRFPQALNAFHDGLRETGYIEGQNVVIEYRWANDQSDRLPALAADLVDRRVAVIVTQGGGTAAALAAKSVTQRVPIVFTTASDPVKVGLVASLNRPGGNVTGIAWLSSALEAKRLGLLHETVPDPTTIAILVNPEYSGAEKQLQDLQEGAARLGVHLIVMRANVEGDFDAAFANLVQARAGALLVCASPFFDSRHGQIIALANRYAVPAMFEHRGFVTSGGLMSYGANPADAVRLVGTLAGQILNGKRPADLPVMQPTKFELVINLKTAKALGLDVPPTVLARADEVIE
jgi:putative ABC transport system substrate-binding protein